MAFKALKYEFVELLVQGTAGGQTLTRFNFPDLPKLRYTALQGLSCYTPGTLTKTPNGNDLPTLAILKNAFLVLYSNERQDLYRIPLLEMNRIQNADTDPFIRSLFEFSNQKVTWDKSYIELGTSPLNTTNFAFALGVFYA